MVRTQLGLEEQGQQQLTFTQEHSLSLGTGLGFLSSVTISDMLTFWRWILRPLALVTGEKGERVDSRVAAPCVVG